MSNVMGIHVNFTMTTHQIWSGHVTVAANFESFYFLPNFISNFRNSYQIWGKSAQERKVTVKKQNSGWKTPPPPTTVLIGLKEIVTESFAVTDMTAVTSAVLFCSKSKGSGFHTTEYP